ncbi:glycogen synthase GlgA [Bacillus shivajii]|uniref:glycogen synthase GlgA n=1 Tax=Bacillus shivajii TaxID=1983719 RepID=UPI001CFB84E2|nr:glycogen synthase GlgA [Bacillus shivajii]UCZ52435.1 glycogen synthase GlgA [Bacillus shivajii]
MKNILFVASECTPFVKTGGLADVIGSLPHALANEEKLNVRVILPMYDEIAEEWKEKLSYVTSFSVEVGWRKQDADLFQIEHNGIVYYFISNSFYFTRKGIYGYYDDGERFVFFNQAVIASLKFLDFTPDILHAHDWQAGLSVALAKIYQPVEHMKTVFTIHNMKYQGVMPVEMFDEFFNLNREHLGGMEWNGMINCLKCGIFHADKVTTVSPTYAEELKHPYFSEGLHSVLNDRSSDFLGIINGVDTNEYHPLKDPHIDVNYRHSRAKKKQNKTDLQNQLGLPVSEDIPLYVMITRLVEQKGLHLIQHILEEFLQEDIQFVVLGTGETEFESYFSYIATKYPDKAVTQLTFDEAFSRKLYASADFFVMPSLFEPCGLSQLIALQYKTAPIVRETGGLKDTVEPYNEATGKGNGFSFTNYNAHDLLAVLRYSLFVYHTPEHWKQLSKNINKSKFGWQKSASDYKDLYEKVFEQQGVVQS